MSFKDKNKLEQPQPQQYRENALKTGKGFPQNPPQTCGLSFRGFNPVKAPKISVKEIKTLKESMHNSVDSREPSLRSSRIDQSRNGTIYPLLETKEIRRRLTDIRDDRTLEEKSRSRDKINLQETGTQRRPLEGLKQMKSPGVGKSGFYLPTESYKSQRFMPISTRITRNLSEINPHSRRIGDFRPLDMQNMSTFPRERPSPIGINLVHSPRKVSQKEVPRPTAPPEPKSIYTAPFHGKF